MTGFKHLLVLINIFFTTAAIAGNFQIIDTQAQFDLQAGSETFPSGINGILEHMNKNGVAMTLIVPPPFSEDVIKRYDFEAIIPAIQHHRDRFAFVAGGGSLSPMILSTPADKVTEEIKQQFRTRAKAIIEAGSLGFGEVTASHMSVPSQMGESHRYSATTPDHPLLLLLADLAAEYDVPIDIHFDVVPHTMDIPRHLKSPRNPEILKENLSAFERLLTHNPKAKISWAHIGSDPLLTRTPRLVRQLMETHPNLYAAIRITKLAPKPAFMLKPNGDIKPAWKKLLRDFPDRFTVHSDAFYYPGEGIKRGSKESLELLNKMLEQLPAPLAAKLAHENARRLYKIAAP